MARDYAPRTIYITENGAAFPDVVDHNGRGARRRAPRLPRRTRCRRRSSRGGEGAFAGLIPSGHSSITSNGAGATGGGSGSSTSTTPPRNGHPRPVSIGTGTSSQPSTTAGRSHGCDGGWRGRPHAVVWGSSTSLTQLARSRPVTKASCQAAIGNEALTSLSRERDPDNTRRSARPTTSAYWRSPTSPRAPSGKQGRARWAPDAQKGRPVQTGPLCAARRNAVVTPRSEPLHSATYGETPVRGS